MSRSSIGGRRSLAQAKEMRERFSCWTYQPKDGLNRIKMSSKNLTHLFSLTRREGYPKSAVVSSTAPQSQTRILKYRHWILLYSAGNDAMWCLFWKEISGLLISRVSNVNFHLSLLYEFICITVEPLAIVPSVEAPNHNQHVIKMPFLIRKYFGNKQFCMDTILPYIIQLYSGPITHCLTFCFRKTCQVANFLNILCNSTLSLVL